MPIGRWLWSERAPLEPFSIGEGKGMAMPLGLCLLFLAWFQSLYLPPFITWHSEIFAFAAAALSFGALLLQRKPQRLSGILFPRITWVFLFLITLVVAQGLIGLIGFGGDALVLCFYIVICIAAAAVGFNGVTTHSVDRSMTAFAFQCAVLVLVGGILSVMVALVQVTGIWEWSSNWILPLATARRPGANLGQPNQLATLILLAIASLVYLFELGHLRAFVSSILATLLLAGLAVTESRAGALSLLLLTGWWLMKRHRIASSTSGWVAVLWLFLFGCSFWFWPVCFSNFNEGGWTESTGSTVNTSAGTRWVVWPQLLQSVLLRPWFGWGLREISTAHNAVLDRYATGEPFTYAHNVILDLAVGVGIPLTIGLVGVIIIWLVRRMWAVNDATTWYCVAFALPFGMHSMFEFPFAYAYFLVPVMVLVGVLEARLSPSSVFRIAWGAVASVWTIVCALMLWSVVEYVAIEEDFRIVRFEAMRMGHTPSEYVQPEIRLLTQLKALLGAGRIVPTPNMDASQIEISRKVAMRFPWTATQNRYALSLALNGDPAEAVRQLKVMRAMHGAEAYEEIHSNWIELANTKYPQLKSLQLP
jgi:hypothetical protein